MAVFHGRSKEVLQLAEALHLEANKVRGFELRCYVDEIVTLKVEYFPEDITITDVEQIDGILKTYELHEVEPDAVK